MSVLNQKGSYELILVDDGSQDRSGEICDRYKGENVRVYHMENSGPGRARNFGAENARGEFLMFVDADDYISDSFFEKLEASNVDFNADVIFFEVIKAFSNGKNVNMAYGLKREKLYQKSREEAYLHISECNKFPATCCAKLVKRRFYEEKKIKVPEGICGEDIDWALQLISSAQKFDFFDGGFYYYRINEGSRSEWGREESVADQLTIIEKWANIIEKSEFSEYFYRILAYQYAMIFPYYGALSAEVRKLYQKKIKKFKYLLGYGKTKKLRIIFLLCKILGISMSSIILYKAVSCRREKF